MFRSLVFCVALVVGCSGTSSEPSARSSSPHGAEGAVAGSHADWCGEHAVPESQCTRCDSSLVPAFQATGDWCPEHGLPESQCLQCTPGLKIERPPIDKAG